MIHLLITGKHYIDFSLERDEALRQIVEESPPAFQSRNIPPWPAVEDVLAKALTKDPAGRFSSVAAFAAALVSVGEPPAPIILLDRNQSSFPTALESLKKILNRLSLRAPLLLSGLPDAPRTSITYGSAGVACALHRIACARQDPQLLSLADLWGERATRELQLDDAWYCADIEITPDVVGRVSPYHTESGVHFVKFLIAYSMGDVSTQMQALDSFIAKSLQTDCDTLDVTLGRSGTLLAAAHLLATMSSATMVNTSRLRDLGDTTMASIWRQLDSYASIRECREIRHSGIAHGWAGILYATLSWCRASGSGLPRNMEARLDQLAALAHRSGRQASWSWTIAGEPGDTSTAIMGGWCGGTAGQVHLWLAAHAALKDDRYLVLANLAGCHVAQIDSQNGSLCCGLSGQAYALLALYRSTNDRAWLYRACTLAERAALAYRHPESQYSMASRIDSLYKGELGVAVLAADLENADFSAMPAFEFTEG
ncbi:MAG: lanthionine synthetase LanC family protein [Candidatus Sulfotelmatobacter sp.]